MSTFTTPILFIFFNKPETTLRVFEQLEKLKPLNLFLLVDGARPEKEGEAETRELLLKTILRKITWNCNLKTFIREKNYNCRVNLQEGITWFFEQVEEGIILEDDCLPDQTFFTYCTEMLAKYRHDTRFMHISGANFMPPRWKNDASYFITRTPHVWGWATWKRAWQKYERNVETLPAFIRGNFISNFSQKDWVQRFWISIFNKVHHQELNTWDYQWTYTVWRNNGLCINPSKNLISNIGFGTVGAIHTLVKDQFAEIPTRPLDFPLVSPLIDLPNVTADELAISLYQDNSLIAKIKRKVKKVLSSRKF